MTIHDQVSKDIV